MRPVYNVMFFDSAEAERAGRAPPGVPRHLAAAAGDRRLAGQGQPDAGLEPRGGQTTVPGLFLLRLATSNGRALGRDHAVTRTGPARRAPLGSSPTAASAEISRCTSAQDSIVLPPPQPARHSSRSRRSSGCRTRFSRARRTRPRLRPGHADHRALARSRARRIRPPLLLRRSLLHAAPGAAGERGSISTLAVGLLATTVAVAVVAHAVIPELTWPDGLRARGDRPSHRPGQRPPRSRSGSGSRAG